jgi:Carboxypeptidase regulatory-like domain
MFIAVLRMLAVALICGAGAGCHQPAATVNSWAAPIGSADTVRDALLTGTVVDSTNNRPVPGAVVIVMVQGKNPFREREHVAEGLTDSAGRYTLRVPHGRYDVFYSRIGFTRLRRWGVLARRGKVGSTVVLLPESHLQLAPTVFPGKVDSTPPSPQR